MKCNICGSQDFVDVGARANFPEAAWRGYSGNTLFCLAPGDLLV